MAKAQAARRKQANPITRYFRETSAELRKVSWPTREEAIRLTILVLIVVILFSAFLGGLDILFRRLVGFLIGLG